MIKILSVDDQVMNHKVVKLDVEDFLDEKDIDFQFYTSNDGLDAIKKIKVIKPQVIFMDMMMPHITGAETIKCIKCLDNIGDPKIIMVTALGDKDTIEKAKEAKADGFITKPFKYEAVETLLTKYLDLESDDDFFDFGDDDSFVDDTNNLILGQIENFNETHHKISANEYLKEYDELELKHILEEVDTIEAHIDDIVSVLYEENLDNKIDEIYDTLFIFTHFLNNFDEFRELSTTINLIMKHFNEIDYTEVELKRKEHIANFIKTLFDDLVKWKYNVFISKDAIDVFYINASMLNSCVQLEALLKNNGND